MDRILEILVGVFTLGLPVLFVLLDQKARPNLLWIGTGDPPPLWGHSIVVIGVALAILVALAEPMTGVDPHH